ncbi:MAG: hypothetical protein JXA11_01985 [Phycisphaerae bacterium]|nr:hypothetical protein [Phycisphaerae bacterium]
MNSLHPLPVFVALGLILVLCLTLVFCKILKADDMPADLKKDQPSVGTKDTSGATQKGYSNPPYLSFKTLRKYYEYDPSLPLQAKLSNKKKIDGGTTYDLTFKGADGYPVYGAITVPDGKGPFPLLIAPGYITKLSSSQLAKLGILTAWIDYRLMDRGQLKDMDPGYEDRPGTMLWARVNTVIDFRRLLDYCFENYSIDKDRVCYGSASKGSWFGCILGAVDPRVKQFMLVEGGADMVLYMQTDPDPRIKKVRDAPWFSPRFFGTMMAPFDTQYFVKQLTGRPVLFQLGVHLPKPTYDKILSLAGEPKTVQWYKPGERCNTDKFQLAARRWLAKQWDMPALAPKDEDTK